MNSSPGKSWHGSKHWQAEMPRILIAQPTGFCFGVERALRLARNALRKYPRVWTYGELVHNPDVLRELKNEGIRIAARISAVRDGAIIIRAHGCPPEVLTQCRARGLEIIDATCPYVRRVQQVARQLAAEGYQVVVVGERNHPEVRAILAAAAPRASVYSPARRYPKSGRIGVVAQTTIGRDRLKAAVANLLDFGYTEIRVFNTICAEVTARQAAAVRLAKRVEAVVVVGGRNSANTTRLAEIIQPHCRRVVHITGPAEIDPAEWQGFCRIGIAAGASTPAKVVAEVARILRMSGGRKDE